MTWTMSELAWENGVIVLALASWAALVHAVGKHLEVRRGQG